MQIFLVVFLMGHATAFSTTLTQGMRKSVYIDFIEGLNAVQLDIVTEGKFGKLSPMEQKEFVSVPRLNRLFDAMDMDMDGVLTREEIRLAQEPELGDGFEPGSVNNPCSFPTRCCENNVCVFQLFGDCQPFCPVIDWNSDLTNPLNGASTVFGGWLAAALFTEEMLPLLAGLTAAELTELAVAGGVLVGAAAMGGR
mmetsp:Transcript_73982/g.123553  ORF Transcript_73982/g.123553 Transcript_73982/m.123553 type:complete len:196 (+) Transcript_73982:65-652(+)